MTEEWFSIAIARSIQRELNVRAVSVLRLDPDHSKIPHELVLKQVAKISEPPNEKWDRLHDEKYSYAETWGLTGTVFLNRKVIQASLYDWKPSDPRRVAGEVSHENFGHEGYVQVFEGWFDEPLAHVLIIPVYLGSRSLGAIKILNRLDAHGRLVPKEAPFDRHEQAFAEGLASVLADIWEEGVKPGSHVEKRVMLSYSHKDMALCNFFANEIKREIPEVAVLRDTDLPAGVRWAPKLHDMIAGCEVAVFVLTEQAVQSEWVRSEWADARKNNRTVVPLVEESAREKAIDRFLGLGDHTFIRFLNHRYEEIVPEIIRAIRAAL